MGRLEARLREGGRELKVARVEIRTGGGSRYILFFFLLSPPIINRPPFRLGCPSLNPSPLSALVASALGAHFAPRHNPARPSLQDPPQSPGLELSPKTFLSWFSLFFLGGGWGENEEWGEEALSDRRIDGFSFIPRRAWGLQVYLSQGEEIGLGCWKYPWRVPIEAAPLLRSARPKWGGLGGREGRGGSWRSRPERPRKRGVENPRLRSSKVH